MEGIWKNRMNSEKFIMHANLELFNGLIFRFCKLNFIKICIHRNPALFLYNNSFELCQCISSHKMKICIFQVETL